MPRLYTVGSFVRVITEHLVKEKIVIENKTKKYKVIDLHVLVLYKG